MSYEIIYDKQFVKVNDNTFIPMILSGSNNCTEWSPSGRERRSRSWFNFGYLLGYAIAGTMEQMLEKQEEQRKKEMERDEAYSDKSYGAYSGLRINGTLASFGAYTGIVKTGCKKALTIEQLAEENVNLHIRTYSSDKTREILKEQGLEPVSFFPQTTKELEDFIKNVEPKYKGKKEGTLYISYSGMYESTPKRIRRKYFASTTTSVEKQEVKSSIGYVVKAIETKDDYTIGYLVSFRGGSFRYSPYNTGGKQHLMKKDAEKIAKKMTARRFTIKFVVEQVVYDSEKTFRVPAGKKVSLPIEKKEEQTDEEIIANLVLLDEGQEIANFFNPNQKCFLDPIGIALHDFIKGCEVLKHYDKKQQALNIFREKYPEEYYVLLD